MALTDNACTIDSVDSERRAGLIQLQSDIDRVIVDCLTRSCGVDSLHEDDDEECCHLTRVGYYFQEINRAHLWPTSMMCGDGWCIEAVKAKVSKMKTYHRDDRRGNINNEPSECADDTWGFRERLTEAVTKAVDNQKGLCLMCLKSGRVRKQDGNCYANESELCTGKA